MSNELLALPFLPAAQIKEKNFKWLYDMYKSSTSVGQSKLIKCQIYFN